MKFYSLKIVFAFVLLSLPVLNITAADFTSDPTVINFPATFKKGAVHAKTLVGTSQRLGNGKIRSWVTFDDGELTAIGVTFDKKALEGLPNEPPPGKEGTEYVLALPAEAANTVFKHVLVNWNPLGHPPADIYSIGHFDIHFYMISSEERRAITAVGNDIEVSNKPLPAEFTPAGYVMAPDTAVPQMGSHWVDPNAHEFHGHGFTKTFLYGSYDGRLIFLEPMITKAYLETKPNVSEAIKLPARFEKSGFYPTKYSIRYDDKKKEYTVALEGMTLR